MYKFQILYVTICLALLLISYLMMKKYTHEQIDETKLPKRNCPPQNMNSFEMGYWYKSFVGTPDVVSLILHLATKGYIQITNKKSKLPVGSGMSFGYCLNGCEITKLKEYNDTNEAEKFFMSTFFENKNVITNRELGYKYKTQNGKLLKELAASNNPNEISTLPPKIKFAKKIINIMLVILTVLLPFAPLNFENWKGIQFIFLLMYLLFVVPSVLRIKNRREYTQESANSISTIVIAGAYITAFISILFLFIPSLIDKDFSLIFVFCTSLISLASTYGFCTKTMPKNDFATILYKEIIGFKKYLLEMDKKEISARCCENPQFFYDTLPYAYTLGISDYWIKNFQADFPQPPPWYRLEDTSFGTPAYTLMNKTIPTLIHEMSFTTQPNGITVTKNY